MKKNIKTIIIVIFVLVIIGIIYFVPKKQSQDSSPIEEINKVENTESIVNDDTEGDTPVAVAKTPTTNITSEPSQAVATNQTIKLLKYQGEFFPFEFSYPDSFRLVNNTRANTKELESRSYNFNRLAFDGGIAGYVSFYVNNGDDEKYKDLVARYPDKYSIIEINGYKFYKHIELNESSNNELKIEYITFKSGTQYRFSLVAINGDRKSLDIKTYQNEFDMMELIIRSLIIN